MIRKVKDALAFCKGGCWKVDVGAYGFLRRMCVNAVRFFSTTFTSFGGHRCGLHAAGLTYFTILGFVPVLCLLMVCAKTCGLGNFARDKVNEQIDHFISNVEKGKEEAVAAAAQVASPEVVAAVTETADSQKSDESAPSEAADSQKKNDPAPSEAADSQKKDETATADAVDSQKKLADVPVIVDDKEKEALYKAKAAKDLAVQARKFANEMFDRIDKVDLTTLGWIGFAVLVWTVVSTLGHVETAVNEVWHVGAHRPIWRKFIVYLFVVIALPIFMSLAVSLPILRLVKTALDATLGATSYTRWVGEALVNLLTSRLFGFGITFTFSSLAFAVLLKAMPNRHVGFRSAFYSGIVTALLVGGWMMLCTTAGIGIAKSGAMYGSFAAVPIVLAWIFMSWQLVLLGSCMSYAFECVHRGSPVLSDR